MSSAFEALRETIDSAEASDRAGFARATRNAVAKTILAAAFERVVPEAPAHDPPPQIFDLLGPNLAGEVAAIYRGEDGWTTHAIDVLEPLNELAKRARRE
ncbi:MAG: hypothetical protein ACJ76I_10350 [Gaiellaceae bacterium]